MKADLAQVKTRLEALHKKNRRQRGRNCEDLYKVNCLSNFICNADFCQMQSESERKCAFMSFGWTPY